MNSRNENNSAHEEPFLVTCMKHTLKLSAVYENPKHWIYEKLHFYAYALLMYPTTAYFHITHLATPGISLALVLEIMLYFNLTTTLFMILVWTQVNKQYFVKCYHNIASDDEYVTDEFFSLAEQEIRQLQPIFVLVFCGIAGFTMLPPLNAMFTDAELGSPSTLIAPPNYPWDSSTQFGYLLTLAFQWTIGLTATATYLSMMLFFSLYWIAMRCHYRIFHRRIAQLDEIAPNTDYRRRKIRDFYHDVMLREQMKLIHYHQFITRFVCE